MVSFQVISLNSWLLRKAGGETVRPAHCSYHLANSAATFSSFGFCGDWAPPANPSLP